MKVKKYVAPTMPEIMNQIRKELGPEAVILNSKQFQHGGILGLFKKTSIEVVAALDPDPLPTGKDRQGKPVVDLETKKNTNNEVLNEIKHLKRMIELKSLQEDESYHPNYRIVYQHLLDQEIDEKYAKQMINTVISYHEKTNPDVNIDLILQDVSKEIVKRLNTLTFQEIKFEKKIIHFVGPTGVGKTTTLAKLAAKSMLIDHKKVAFITTDTYRIAAIEQLKTYARILNIPVEVAYTMEDYKMAISKFATYDLILVDTAGRNFRDEKYVKELKETTDVNLDIAIYLVLSLTAKPKDLTEIYDQFHLIPIKEVIFTKIDETRQYGSIVNIALDKQISIAYLTNGQDVPDDLIRVTPKKISDLITGGYDNE